MRVPENTSEHFNSNWPFYLNPQAIEIQEKQGQAELCSSDVLPTEIRFGKKETLEKAGVVFLGQCEKDPVFTYVKLPLGWRIRPDPYHSMWSDLTDENGRVRAAIFYKAASYDRRAYTDVITENIGT